MFPSAHILWSWTSRFLELARVLAATLASPAATATRVCAEVPLAMLLRAQRDWNWVSVLEGSSKRLVHYGENYCSTGKQGSFASTMFSVDTKIRIYSYLREFIRDYETKTF